MFTVPNLPYDYSALEPHIDEQTMRIHHDKHHASYVKNLNEALKDENNLGEMDVVDLMKNLAKVPEDLRTKVRNNGGGHANHSLFWSIMGSNAGGQPQGALADAIRASFADFETFKDIFSKAALGRFGSGWAWLVVEGNTLAVTDTANQDTPLSESKTPILGLDVWEHAYYLKYQNRRVDYIEAWWNVVNWKKVEENFQKAQG